MFDGFNILNSDLIRGYGSNNVSRPGSTALPTKPSERISSILAPRIFRIGASFTF
jgi:hypothetical protein